MRTVAYWTDLSESNDRKIEVLMQYTSMLTLYLSSSGDVDTHCKYCTINSRCVECYLDHLFYYVINWCFIEYVVVDFKMMMLCN